MDVEFNENVASDTNETIVEGKKKNRLCIVILLIVLLFLGTAVGGGYYFYSNTVYSQCIVEAGVDVEASDFAINPEIGLEFAEESPVINKFVPGDYPVILELTRADFIKFKSILTVEDTIAPVANVHNVTAEAGTAVDPNEFLTDISDITETTVLYLTQPDMEHYGTQKVSVQVLDLGGNSSTYEAELTISPVIEQIVMEAGDECPDEKEFLVSKTADNIHIIPDLSMIDTSKIGEYNIAFSDSGRLFYSKLVIQDTKAPVLKIHDVNAYCTSILSENSFVEKVDEVSEYELSFEDKPDMRQSGTQDVTVIATDIAGNETKETCKLTLVEDTEAPVISGVHDLRVFVGSGISYKSGIKVTDNCDAVVKLDVDTGGASSNASGQYTITYRAMDRAGNETVQTALLTVSEISYTEGTIYPMADAVLANIINDGMGPKQKLDAIYGWVRGNIAYANHSDKSNWLRGAYEGLQYRKGDCFVYFATAKALLIRAGIVTTDIQKVPGYSTMHYWNLVDIGEGWHHYDTCPRVGGGVFNYLSNAEMMAYSNSHGNSHIYDPSLYPEIQ